MKMLQEQYRALEARGFNVIICWEETPMDHSMAPQTHVFKLNCAKCQRKAKKLLSRLNGVYSIKVDADAGKVIIKSTVHPDILAAAIREIMKGQCEPLTPPNNNNVGVEQWINNIPVPAAANNGNAHCQNQFKGYEVADLHELARVPRVKELEFTQTRNIKMIFNDEKGGPSRPPSEPKNDFAPNNSIACDPSECEAGPSTSKEEPKKASGSNHISACDPSECHSHVKAQHEPKKCGGPYSCAPGDCHEPRNVPYFAEVLVNSGPYYCTPPCYPYHFYPPPPYYGHPPPMPPKNNDAHMHCDDVPKCRMV
ncbi:hypothetical protein L6164_034570 [Bauhinia variegata]|uniref:Uncharacterized protein n=1 Tax=Bauhinia variegata TaxID=167791 RepID=A0ACB9KVA8_BAUVA|nr:hypothetical protein L6164_034570 [Bauhinia variegata]